MPSGAEFEALVFPVDQPQTREKFSSSRVLIGKLPTEDEATRWKVNDGEFRFYFNDTESAKENELGAGEFEVWDAETGQITPLKESAIRIAPGKARLLLKK